MTKERIEVLKMRAANMDDQAEKVILECLEEIELLHSVIDPLANAVIVAITDKIKAVEL